MDIIIYNGANRDQKLWGAKVGKAGNFRVIFTHKTDLCTYIILGQKNCGCKCTTYCNHKFGALDDIPKHVATNIFL